MNPRHRLRQKALLSEIDRDFVAMVARFDTAFLAAPKPRAVRYLGPPGKRHGNCKLTESDVVEMRSRPFTLSELCVRWGINRGTACRIVTGKSWKHVPMGKGA